MNSTVPRNADLYDILGIGKDATDQEIQRAYRKLALKYHPDRNPDDATAAENFKRASEAYEILKDPEKRAAYDTGGMSGVYGTGFEGFADNEQVYSHFGDLFSELFGGHQQPRRTGPSRGQDLRFVLTVDFKTAALGARQEIEAPIAVTCDSCKGSGTTEESPETCSLCHGSGQIARQSAEHGGYFTLQSRCPQCDGAGTSGMPCSRCQGQGRVDKTRKITVTIPTGIQSGQVLRLRGQGPAGLRGGPQGDLLIEINVRPDPVFHREKNNIRSVVHIPLLTALLGGKVDVTTLHGTVSMTVPAGTSSDRVLRIRGQGIDPNGVKGDHLVRIDVDVPKIEFTEEQKSELRKQLANPQLASP